MPHRETQFLSLPKSKTDIGLKVDFTWNGPESD